ncbi:MAG TPA: IS4 family transposase [Candidatus Merdenecus merdavium]|jgi:hypothetical protein|nr:IS4 family transposase [Candidatus Merdenecus merdavium]
MAQNYLSNLKSTLDNCIAELDDIHFMFCQNPESDFTRNRKLSFQEYIQLMIQMQSKSVSNELLDFFNHSLSAPSKSAFTQQRYKLQPEGWSFLFHSFVEQCRTLSDNLYHGYRLLACDGSDVNIDRNPNDERTFINEGEKGYNAIHINALYDIINMTYCDFIVQGKKKLHEREALNSMIDRYADPIPAILMADRGYESFNVFAHLIHKNMNFVIRMKDINSNGILSAYDLPDSEFDTYIRTTLTRRYTKKTLGNPNTYTILQPVSNFDFLDESCTEYDIEFRIVRILLDNGTYICIATNLSKEDFSLEEIKKLYRMRWSEETSFRELKYTIGLVNWHSSKYEGILQEINARMILYNFCELVTTHAVVRTRANTKHSYKINFATAVNICKAYLKHGSDEIEIMLLIQKHLTPVRPDRKYPINLRPKRNREFLYRAA